MTISLTTFRTLGHSTQITLMHQLCKENNLVLLISRRGGFNIFRKLEGYTDEKTRLEFLYHSRSNEKLYQRLRKLIYLESNA